MHFKVTILLLIVAGLFLSGNAVAQPTHPKNHEFRPQINHTQPRQRPSPSGIGLQQLIMQSRLYEYLLHHPDFIKIQGILNRIMALQSANKRRIMYQRIQGDPLKTR